MDYIDESDWLGAVSNTDYRTEADYRRALSGLRFSAKHDWNVRISDALKTYLSESGGALPRNSLELAAYSEEEIDESILARYRIVRDGEEGLMESERGKIVLIEKPVDPLWDYKIYFTKGSFGMGSSHTGNTCGK